MSHKSKIKNNTGTIIACACFQWDNNTVGMKTHMEEMFYTELEFFTLLL